MGDQRGEEVSKGAHCARKIRYHTVFSVKYRKALLDDSMTVAIQEAATEIAEWFQIEMEAIGTDENLIHRLYRAHPKMAPGWIVQIVKSITAQDIVRRKPAIKRVRWGPQEQFLYSFS